MQTPAATLRHEHEAIEHLLAALDAMADRLDAGEPVPRADIDAAVGVASGFADACHHAKEEKVLFGALRDHGQTAALRIVDELEEEHKAARGLIAAMRDAAPAIDSGDAAGRRRLATDAHRYTKLLRAHIAHENKDLLPLADELPSLVRDRLAEEFERVEREETGSGAHERFEHTIHDLHARYGA